MSWADKILQRAFDEQARKKIREEEKAAEAAAEAEQRKKAAEEQFEDVQKFAEDVVIEDAVIDVDGTEVLSEEEHMFHTPREAAKEAVVEEPIEEQMEEPVISEKVSKSTDTKPVSRKDAVGKEWEDFVFPEDMSEEDMNAIRTIAMMPEQTLDDVTMKAAMLQNYHKSQRVGLDSAEVSMGIYSSHVALEQLHKQYDADGGMAWFRNERKNPLPGWTDVVAAAQHGNYDAGLQHTVNVQDYLKENQVEPVNVPEGKQDMSELKRTPESENPQPVGTSEELKTKESEPSEKPEKSDDEKPKEEQQPLPKTEDAESDKKNQTEDGNPKPLVNPQLENPKGDKEWADGYSDSFAGYRSVRDDGMVEYDGVLGKFTFDPTQFQLQVVDVPADDAGNPATSYPILRYVGSEVDGKNIQIPDGLEDGSFMFENNKDLQSMPKLPSTLKVGFGMFRGCSDMQSAHAITLPTKLSDAQFMFADCTNMVVGPATIPGNVKDATGMFANCKNLGRTPVILPGVQCGDSMFANCESLTKKPKLPTSMKYADYATEGCTGIDAAEKQAAAKATQKQQQKFEKALDKKSFRDRLGSLFSACMQVHAMRKSGNNMFHAMLMTHAMRKSGVFSRDMAGGWAALYKSNRSNFNQFMMMSSKNSADKKAAAKAAYKQEQTQAFEATSSEKKQSSKQDRTMYGNGARAMKAHYFENVAKRGYPAQKSNLDAVRYDAQELKTMMQARKDMGTLDATSKTYYAKKAIELVSNQTSYYKGAAGAVKTLKSEDGSKYDTKPAWVGLNKVSRSNMSELASTIQEMQSEHQFMNQRQFASVCELMEQTPYGKTDAYKKFKDTIAKDMASRAQYASVEHGEAMKSHRRVDYRDVHHTRGEEAEAAFGFTGSQYDGSSGVSGSDVEYGV